MSGSTQFVFESPLKNAPVVVVVGAGALAKLAGGVRGAKVIVEGAPEA
jgi:hypothetical protein